MDAVPLRLVEGRSLDEELALAMKLVEAASQIALDHFRAGVEVGHKADGTSVTKADLAIERLIVEALASERPDDAVLGEEGGGSFSSGAHGGSRWTWLVDPIDGTSHFAAGEVQWGTHLALAHDDRVVLGVITRPARGCRWWATRGGGAFREDLRAQTGPRRLRVSTIADFRESRVSLWAQRHPAIARIEQSAVRVSPDLDDILRLAEGELEAVVDFEGRPWDHAPAVVLVVEAGGAFEDRLGGQRIDAGEGRYSNGHIAGALREVLSEVARHGVLA